MIFSNEFFISLATIGSPAVNPFFANVLLVCLDCEGRQSTQGIRTSELGLAVLDTKDLSGVPLNAWPNHLKSYNFRTAECMNTRPAG